MSTYPTDTIITLRDKIDISEIKLEHYKMMNNFVTPFFNSFFFPELGCYMVPWESLSTTIAKPTVSYSDTAASSRPRVRGKPKPAGLNWPLDTPSCRKNTAAASTRHLAGYSRI